MFHSKLFWVYVLQCQPHCHCRWHVITWCCSSCVAIKTDLRFGPATIDTCWCHPSDVLFSQLIFKRQHLSVVIIVFKKVEWNSKWLHWMTLSHLQAVNSLRKWWISLQIPTRRLTSKFSHRVNGWTVDDSFEFLFWWYELGKKPWAYAAYPTGPTHMWQSSTVTKQTD